MANGHPKIGGTNGVPELDLGQEGGTRHGAGDAFFTGHVFYGADETIKVEHRLPQQNITFEDDLGFSGSQVRIEGTLRTKTAAIYESIRQEINERLHGSLRDGPGGGLLAADPTMIRETQITDAAGTTVAERAVLRRWSTRDRARANNEWAVIVPITLEFRVLG